MPFITPFLPVSFCGYDGCLYLNCAAAYNAASMTGASLAVAICHIISSRCIAARLRLMGQQLAHGTPI